MVFWDFEVPAGLRDALERLRPTSRQVLLSNTPAYGIFGLLGEGAATAYLDPFGVGPLSVSTFWAPVLKEMLPTIEAWAEGAPPPGPDRAQD